LNADAEDEEEAEAGHVLPHGIRKPYVLQVPQDTVAFETKLLQRASLHWLTIHPEVLLVITM